MQLDLELKLLDVIRDQLPDGVVDELLYYWDEDPSMFAAVVSGEVSAGKLVLSDELKDVVRRILQGSEAATVWEPDEAS